MMKCGSKKHAISILRTGNYTNWLNIWSCKSKIDCCGVCVARYYSISFMKRPLTMAKIYKLENEKLRDVTSAAYDSLQKDNVIGVPTDTIYGVAGLAQSIDAVSKIYTVKLRPSTNPVAICVADITDISKWAEVTVNDALLHSLLPGPVTLVFKRSAELNTNLNPDTHRVGVRIPDHDFLRELCRKCQAPLALTSANVSGEPSTLAVEEFCPRLLERLDLVVDGGRLNNSEKSRLGSTVIDLTRSGSFSVIRPGCALKKTLATLEEFGLVERTMEITHF